MLRKVVQNEVVNFFQGDLWADFLNRTRFDTGIRHAHLFMDSSLSPATVARITKSYFQSQGIELRRSIWLTSEGPGFGNCYYIAPVDRCHFEIFLRFNPDVVLEPMSPKDAIGGKVIDEWDDNYMDNYHSRFAFKDVGVDEEKEIRNFFVSDAWEGLCNTMIYNGQRNKHCHCMVTLGVHPDEVARIGLEMMKKRGWVVDRAVPLTFRGDVGGQNSDENFEFAKITFLVSQPETVLEIEWEFDPTVTISPKRNPLSRLLNTDMIKSDLGGLPYYSLTDLDIHAIIDRIKAEGEKNV